MDALDRIAAKQAAFSCIQFKGCFHGAPRCYVTQLSQTKIYILIGYNWG